MKSASTQRPSSAGCPGRVPYRRHRYAVAAQLTVDEAYLWPGALSRDQVTAASEGEVLAIYPHRADVPRDAWQRLFSSAEREIGVLVYSGLFLAEDVGLAGRPGRQGPRRGAGPHPVR